MKNLKIIKSKEANNFYKRNLNNNNSQIKDNKIIDLIKGRKLRRLHPASFVGKLEYLVNEKDQRYFTIQDDNFIVDNRHVINICNEIVRRGLDIQFEIAGGM